ncbi:MAG: hypothetical protein WA354_18970 [Terracidiphilus sp.]
MRVLSTGWLWLSLGVIAAGILCFRILAPRFTNPNTLATIPDLSVTSPLNQPGGGDAPPEAYEIYSALYQQPQQEPLAFAEESRTDIPQVNGSCLKPSTPQEHEMSDSFVAANQQSHRWAKKFTIPAAYLLLSQSATAKALDCLAGGGKNGVDCGVYRSLRHVRYLGVPGFDRAHDRALVSVEKMCGMQCGSGGVFEVKKAGSAWVRAEPNDFTRECSWMY